MLEVEQYHDDRRGESEPGRRGESELGRRGESELGSRGGSADGPAGPTAGITGSTAREIATSAEAAIREGRLGTGDALPTVRALATALGTSPATVNSAYRILRQRGLVIAEGRRGTRVAPRPALRAPQRPDRRAQAGGPDSQLRDLTIG